MIRKVAILLASMALSVSAQKNVASITVCAPHKEQGLPQSFFGEFGAGNTFNANGLGFAGPAIAGACPDNAVASGTPVGAFASECDPNPFQVVDVTTACGPTGGLPACPGTNAIAPTAAQVRAFCAARTVPAFDPTGGAFCFGTLGLNNNVKYGGHILDFSYTAAVTYTLSGGYALLSVNNQNTAATGDDVVSKGYVTCHYAPTVATTAQKILGAAGKFWKTLPMSKIASVTITTKRITTIPAGTADSSFNSAAQACMLDTIPNVATADATPAVNGRFDLLSQCSDGANIASALLKLRDSWTDPTPKAIDWSEEITITAKKSFVNLSYY